jgi:hypothetical protein
LLSRQKVSWLSESAVARLFNGFKRIDEAAALAVSRQFKIGGGFFKDGFDLDVGKGAIAA